MAKKAAETIYVLNGPDLAASQTRELDTSGGVRLADVERLCTDAAAKFGLKTDCRQSRGEGELIDFIHEAQVNKAAGIVISAGTRSPNSIALLEALAAAKIPAIEVHIGNIRAHENFRHHPFTAKAACATLTGFGIDGYRLAINGLAASIGVTAKA
jgi:3-dehydroquinate dehydratase-2